MSSFTAPISSGSPTWSRWRLTLGASRVEIAHVQYYGWALQNRAALMPTAAQVARAAEAVEALRQRHHGEIVIDAVVPDYHARLPKPCVGGWGRRSLNVTPAGKVLPCHAAETIPGLEFWSVREHSLADIWKNSPAFNAFRGTAWMQEPCRSCARRDIDFGGCRCQAFALTGDARATDPVCHLAPQPRRASSRSRRCRKTRPTPTGECDRPDDRAVKPRRNRPKPRLHAGGEMAETGSRKPAGPDFRIREDCPPYYSK